MKKIIILILILFYSFVSHCQLNLDSLAKNILDEGLFLFNLEKSAWVATDIIMADKNNLNYFNGYASYLIQDSVYTIFYFYTPDKISINFTVSFPLNKIEPNSCSINAHSRKPTVKETRLISAKNKIYDIINETPSLNSNLNIINYNIQIKDVDSSFICYLMAGINDPAIIPLGGDSKIDLSGNLKDFKIQYYHSGFLGMKIQKLKIKSDFHTHLPEYSPFIAPTEICIYKLYDELLNNCFRHKIICGNFVSDFNSKKNRLQIFPFHKLMEVLCKEEGLFDIKMIEENNEEENNKFVFIEKSIDTSSLIFKRTFKCIGKPGDDVPSLFRSIKMNALKIGANCFKLNNFKPDTDMTFTLILDTYYASDSLLNINFQNCEKNSIYIFGINEFNYSEFSFYYNNIEKTFNSGEYFKISLQEGDVVKIKKGNSIGGKVKIKYFENNPSKFYIITGYEISPGIKYLKPDGHMDFYFKTGSVNNFDPNLGHLLSLIYKRNE